MLERVKATDVDKYIDVAYALSQDLTRSSFPTYVDGIKTRSDFLKVAYDSFYDDTSEILLFTQEHVFKGWIHYYVLHDDKYIGIKVFNIDTHFDVAMDEFLAFVNSKYINYKVYIGFPSNNKDAIKYFKKHDIDIADNYNVFVLDFDKYEYHPESEQVVEVNLSNYSDFKTLHDNYDSMYWNSDKLYDELRSDNSTWKLYMLIQDGVNIGNIYFLYLDKMVEIFGIDYIDDMFCKNNMMNLLIRALNQSKSDGNKYLTFFANEHESDVLKELKLDYIAKYMLYII